MAVYGNFKGTTQPGFTVGKTGAATIHGNPSSPPASATAGDVWMDSANTALKIYDGSDWSEGTFIGNLEGFIEIEVIAGESLSKGDVVYVSGSSGNTPQVSKALSNAGGAKMPAIGIAKQTINSGNRGYVVVQGLLTGINTSAFAEGDVLYVSSTVAGTFVNTAPTGEENKIQNVGKVINSAGGGSILVTGAGRFNATNALDSGNIFLGNGSNQAVTAPLDTSVSDLGYLKNVVEDTTPQLGGELDANGNDITNLDFLRLNTDGQGLRMTNVGALDNTGGNVAGNFRIFATNNLILNAGGNSGNAIVVDKTTLDATFAGTITVHNEYTFPSADGTANQFLQTDGSGAISFADGPIGFTGSQGDTGFNGSQGDQGTTGFTGSQGDQGNIGFTGSQGDQGVVGFTGSQGDQGIIGFTGSQGDTGFKGDTGFTGSRGDVSQGGAFVFAQSTASNVWQVFHNLDEQYVNVEVIDSSGNSLVGTANYPVITFEDSVSLTCTFTSNISGYVAVTSGGGEQGNVGFVGSQGNQGNQGLIGFTGSRGVQGFTGSQGDRGFDGSVGFTGSQGESVTAGAFVHTQSSAATTWTIDHNLNSQYLNVEVIDSTGNSLTGRYSYPTVNFTSANTTTLTFQTSTSGYAAITSGGGQPGATGFTGSTGFNGSQGNQGLIGYTGSKGDVGIIGFTGSQGIVGFNGSNGFTGSQGGFGGATFEYDWSTDTALSDPGTGTVKINNANLTAGTILSIDDEDAQGTDIQQFLRTIDDSTSAIKGHFRMANKLDATDFALYTISAISEETGYFEVTVAYVDGSATSFTNGEELIMTFARTGDKGDTGFTGSIGGVGFTGSKGDTGFTGSQGDQGLIGFSGSIGVGATGPTGFTGSKGNIGYTGSIGFTGSQGNQGFIGFTGSASNVQGDVGFTGSQGNQGLIGFTGSKGDTGFTGSAGLDVYGVDYNFDTSTTEEDPGSGDFRFSIAWSSGNSGNAYEVYLSDTDANNAAALRILNTLDDSTNDNKSVCVLYKKSDPTVSAIFYVTGVTTDTGWRTLAITYIEDNNWSSVSNGDAIYMNIGIIGDQGELGYSGSVGYTGSQGLTGAQGNVGFTGSASTEIGFTGSRGEVGFDGSIGFTGSASTTQGPIGFTGSQGDQGIIGYTGSKGDTGFNGSAGAENATLDSVTDNGSTTTNSITTGGVQTTVLTTGSNATAGTVTGDWTLTAGSTWEATYADLAEKYTTDGPYEAGTVMKFGGDAELTQSDTHNDTRVAGVMSDAPAFTMNGGIDGQYLALAGRVPVKVVGAVTPGDLLVASDTTGHAIVNNNAATGTVIGKAITADANGVCEALVTLM